MAACETQLMLSVGLIGETESSFSEHQLICLALDLVVVSLSFLLFSFSDSFFFSSRREGRERGHAVGLVLSCGQCGAAWGLDAEVLLVSRLSGAARFRVRAVPQNLVLPHHHRGPGAHRPQQGIQLGFSHSARSYTKVSVVIAQCICCRDESVPFVWLLGWIDSKESKVLPPFSVSFEAE